MTTEANAPTVVEQVPAAGGDSSKPVEGVTTSDSPKESSPKHLSPKDAKETKESSTPDTEKSSPSDSSPHKQRRRVNTRRSYSRRQGPYVSYDALLKQHEEAQKLKKVLETGVTGRVKWFSLRFHYGFIQRDDGNGDIFVHQMNIVNSRMRKVYFRSLAPDEAVVFDVVEGNSGKEAANVSGPDNAPVRGVYIYHIIRRDFHDKENSTTPQRRGIKARGSQRRRNDTKKSEPENSTAETTPDQSSAKDGDTHSDTKTTPRGTGERRNRRKFRPRPRENKKKADNKGDNEEPAKDDIKTETDKKQAPGDAPEKTTKINPAATNAQDGAVSEIGTVTVANE